ncbi:glycosyltransferase family 2 protein [Providencia huaxiensis]|uniref:glycosyltransferase family 2 protein n=1 Tax=Providencia TaxID=586 RepID=UPI002349A311|nr:glycosyltransferase [Providencia sp. PROV076]
MIKKPLISVIIPVYNVEKYIEKSITSVKEQIYHNFEAIIINDGSTDNSILIAQKIIENDNRFVILNKENGGLSSARNLGINTSIGEFITFLDSDDYLEPSFLYDMVKHINDGVDIISCNINNVLENGEIISHFISPFQGLYLSKDIFDSAIESTKISCVAWGKLYRRTLFIKNNLLYKEGILYEDFPITYILFYHSIKIYFVKEALINYVQRDLSITKKFNPKVIDDSYWSICDMKRFLNEKNIFHQYEENFNNAYLIHYVYRITKLSVMHGQNFNYLSKFKKNLNNNIFTLKNILLLFKKNKKIGGALLLLKVNTLLFYSLVKLKA